MNSFMFRGTHSTPLWTAEKTNTHNPKSHHHHHPYHHHHQHQHHHHLSPPHINFTRNSRDVEKTNPHPKRDMQWRPGSSEL
ncbi:hypothetical protein Hanom_Chr07g00641311 [Helianthus anomalus]